MRLALAQINPTVGALDANAALIQTFADKARKAEADLLVFPELALTGYPPRDLLLQEGFIDAVVRCAKHLGQTASKDLTIVFGAPLPVDEDKRSGRLANALVVYRDGALVDYYDKRLLPTYDVFDEDRYFEPGDRAVSINVAGTRVGLTICEDLWRGDDVGFSHHYRDSEDPVKALMALPQDLRPQLIVNPSASPFVLGKGKRHNKLVRKHATRHGVFVAAVNQVGGNDELIFDGHALVVAPDGSVHAAAPGFTEHLLVCNIDQAPTVPHHDPRLDASAESLVTRALVLGVRDYLGKIGFSKAVLGLSGGIDSAATAVIAAAALGPENVLGVSMPSRYSSQGSKDDAHDLAERLGIKCITIPIEGPFLATESVLEHVFKGRKPDVTEENIQSRLRGTILMALSNKFGHLLLTTGNKSELAVGYCTLYGDMNGGLAVLSDVAKTMVYRMSRWINENPGKIDNRLKLTGPPIPESTITKPPSAELRHDQVDQDSLPPYEDLDEIIERYVELRQSTSRIIDETGFDEAVVRRMIRLIDLNEFKRKQAAIGLKVSSVAFGSGRRMPIARGRWTE